MDFDLTWLLWGLPIAFGLSTLVKVRSSQQAATQGRLDDPSAAGQAVVLYAPDDDGDRVLGGGRVLETTA